MDNIITYTASEARKNFYSLVKKASKGLSSYEINLRDASPVVLIGKAELESWLETMDIMASPEEARAIARGRKDKTAISLKELLKELEGSGNDNSSQKRSSQKF